MGTKINKFIYFLIICIYGKAINAYSFGTGDPMVKLTRRAAGYNLNMPENNHETDFRMALFTVYDYMQGADPPYLKNDPGFNYSIEKYFNNWIFYSDSSFDYETNLRFHVINLGVGANEFKTLTLLIDNIDDEPPVLSCPDKLSIMENHIYNTTTTPLRCSVFDPDGFLNQTTFTIIGENKDIFEFILPEIVDDMAQSIEVPIIVKQPLNGTDTPIVTLTVEVKDGAGHNTIPDADITFYIEVNVL